MTGGQVDLAFTEGSDPVAIFRREGRSYPALSERNPARHAQRLLDSLQAPVPLISGLSGGRVEREAMERVAGPVISLEPDPGRALLALDQRSYRELMGEERFVAAWGNRWQDIVLATYLPAVHGNLELIEVPGSADAVRRELIREGMSGLRDRLAADLATQGAFGFLWFRNTLCNLLALLRTPVPSPGAADPAEPAGPSRSPRSGDAILCGAGPSLDRFLAQNRNSRPTAAVFSADTALPALIGARVQPDLVGGIDPQAIAGTHLRRGLPSSTVVALELTACPLPPRFQPRLELLAGPSPFARYFGEGIAAPLSVRAGTVAELLAAVARSRGLRITDTPGMDFSYPGRMAYARDSSVVLHARDLGDRTRPAESWTAGVLFRQPLTGPRSVPSTAQLQSYRDAFLQQLQALPDPEAGTPGSSPGVSGMTPEAIAGLVLGRMEEHRDRLQALEFGDVSHRRNLSALMLVPGMAAWQRKWGSAEAGALQAFAAERDRQLRLCRAAMSLSVGPRSV